jgi:hypothetical protein
VHEEEGPPLCLRKRRFSPLFKPNSTNASGNLLPHDLALSVVYIEIATAKAQRAASAGGYRTVDRSSHARRLVAP